MTGHTSETDAYRDDRAHVFHSWSAQRALDPSWSPAASAARFWDRRGQPVPRLLLAAGQLNLGHQHPRRRRDPGAGGGAVHGRADHRQPRPQRGRPPHRGGGARRPVDTCSSPTAAPRPTSTRSGWRGLTPAGTSPGRVPVATMARPPADRADRRPAALGERASDPGGRAVLRAVSLPVLVPLTTAERGDATGAGAPRRGVHVRGAAHRRRGHRRVGRRHQRHPRAAARVPRGGPRAVRPARRRAHRRRGDERVRPLRRMVRGRPLGCGAGPDHFAKGVNSGYVPLGGVVLGAEGVESSPSAPFPGGLRIPGTPWRAPPRSPPSR